jgi:DnaJ family protein C protein 3
MAYGKDRPLYVGFILKCWFITLFTQVVVAVDPSTVSVGKLRSDADAAMIGGDIEKSIKLMTVVIQREPEKESNYLKRYRAYLRLKKYKEAYSDLTIALTISPKSKSALGARFKLGLQLGRCQEAVIDLQTLKSINPEAKEIQDEGKANECHSHLVMADRYEGQSHLEAARDSLSRTLVFAENSHDLHLRRAKIEIELGNYFEAVADSGRCIKLESNSMDALEIRGLAYYKLNEHEMAMNHWRQALHFDPEHVTVKNHYRRLKKLDKSHNRAEAAAAEADHESAIKHWKIAIDVDESHKLFIHPTMLKIAKSYVALKSWDEAIVICDAALSLGLGGEADYEAMLVMGEAHLGGEKYDESVRWYQRASELRQDDNRAKEGLQKAQVALKQSKEVDYYKVLGVPRTATTKEIKKAYRAAALEHHPDKVGENEREAAEQKFMGIAAAYEILSDDDTRAKYDRGEDVSGNAQQGQGHGGQHFHHHGGQHFHFQFRH